MSKYCEIEQLKADIREAYRGKNEFMADAICSVIDKRAVKATRSNLICNYCTTGCPDDWCKGTHFSGRKVIFVD